LSAAFLLALVGCSISPKYHPPLVTCPCGTHFSTAVPTPAAMKHIDKGYQQSFLLERTKLTRLVDKIHERLADHTNTEVLCTARKGDEVMNRTASVSILVICAAGIGALLSCGTVAPQGDKDHKKEVAPPYNPYLPGILPGELNSEIERVLREVDLVEARALARWHALGRPQ
jgi:hypothetical protein